MAEEPDNVIDLQKIKQEIEDSLRNPSDIDDLEAIVNRRETAEVENPHLKKMNERHAFVNSVGGRPMIMCLEYSHVYKKEVIEFRTPDSIVTQYANEVAPNHRGDGLLPLGKWWITHPWRLEYDTVIFDPTKEPGANKDDYGKHTRNYYNLWQGMSIEPAPTGTWRLTIRHIWRILCNKDKVKFKYVMRWLAWCIQNPGQRAEVALIFKGKKGAGKGFLPTQFLSIFGIHGMTLSNPEQLIGKHNGHLETKCFIFADEAFYPGDKEGENVLKACITEKYLTVEPKFQQIRQAINCLHIMMSTNNDWVIPASQDERRYFINEVDNRYAKNHVSDEVREAYFNRLWGEMDSGGVSFMLHKLSTMKINNWHPRNNIPETKELRKQITLSLKPAEKAIMAFLENGIFPGVLSSKGYFITSKALMDYIDDLSKGSNRIAVRLKTNILQALGAYTIRDAKERGWILPPLEDMKTAWNREISRHDWDDMGPWLVKTQDF